MRALASKFNRLPRPSRVYSAIPLFTSEALPDACIGIDIGCIGFFDGMECISRGSFFAEGKLNFVYRERFF